jgi:Carboxypeptidase regulatory-like domain/Bacterial Ig-like domain (group 2)
MRRYSVAVVCAAALALIAWACSSNSGSSSSSSPSGTTGAAAPTVTSVTVTVISMTVTASAQFTAWANLSDGTQQIVTSQATWQSSATAVATVTTAGVVRGVSVGAADITATYQGVSGVAHIQVFATPFTVAVTGTITNAMTGAPIANVGIALVNSAGTKNATTDGNGNYSIAAVATGSATVTASLTGYLTNSKTATVSADTRVDIALTPSTTGGGGGTSSGGSSPAGGLTLPSRNANVCKLDDIVHPDSCINNSFGNATALCTDGARSCSTSNSGTCSSHSGVYCFVCPGVLCPP